MRKTFGEFAFLIYGFGIAVIINKCVHNQSKYIQQITFMITLAIIIFVCLHIENRMYKKRKNRGRKKCKSKEIY
ncbi:TPA: hypothetical protein ACTZ52_004709 [Bacillus cereus]